MGKYDSNPIIEGRYDAYGRKTYWEQGHTGKGLKIAVIDEFTVDHGHMMASVNDHLAYDAELHRLNMVSNATYAIAAQLRECIRLGINIVSISRGADSDDNNMHDAVKACRAAGMVIFCSAGNDGDKFADHVSIMKYPASYPETISVLSMDNSFMPSTSSSHGSTGWITGFGQNILVKNMAGEECLASGTSPVTPACASTLALHWSKVLAETGKHMTPAEAEQFVISHCVDYGAVGRDNMTGHGFFTLDPAELKRVKLMILDYDKDGLEDRVGRIKALMDSGVSYDDAVARMSYEYYVVSHERINGVIAPIYGGRKPM